MLQIKTSKDFDRDIRKVKLTTNLVEVLTCLSRREVLPKKYKDHVLTGNWNGWRDCHINPDLVLIYKTDDETLYLARLNSHSEIFG
ncbi:type II toxin-antitoxin system YafQ family toxin [Pelistega sp. NLN82]|uniref:Type II toxin-antitoxin system YafQ family toxin n=1 Tax=Pelistega ratti TaxID=2652177 RepID=A0A6L9Y9N1_9BURK|nr:type II toxin-antitoxin system YafQ family toxin [Pelistega ratti]NEN76518.1 type II toxin-antitoxin system YafQ family toxin [Pelistega ratti]